VSALKARAIAILAESLTEDELAALKGAMGHTKQAAQAPGLLGILSAPGNTTVEPEPEPEPDLEPEEPEEEDEEEEQEPEDDNCRPSAHELLDRILTLTGPGHDPCTLVSIAKGVKYKPWQRAIVTIIGEQQMSERNITYEQVIERSFRRVMGHTYNDKKKPDIAAWKSLLWAFTKSVKVEGYVMCPKPDRPGSQFPASSYATLTAKGTVLANMFWKRPESGIIRSTSAEFKKKIKDLEDLYGLVGQQTEVPADKATIEEQDRESEKKLVKGTTYTAYLVHYLTKNPNAKYETVASRFGAVLQVTPHMMAKGAGMHNDLYTAMCHRTAGDALRRLTNPDTNMGGALITARKKPGTDQREGPCTWTPLGEMHRDYYLANPKAVSVPASLSRDWAMMLNDRTSNFATQEAKS
jgi:hypothetical protein